MSKWIVYVALACSVVSLAVSGFVAYRVVGDPALTREEGLALREQLRQLSGLLAGRRAPAADERPAAADPVRTPIATDLPILGKASATVMMLEFTDFQCPFCRRFHHETFPVLKEKYIDTGRVRFAVHQLPLPIHPQARAAAAAFRCAAGQGKPWAMVDWLFANAARLKADGYDEPVRALGLDSARFEACRTAPATAAWLDAQLSEAQRLNIRGTPTFVLGRVTDGQLEGRRIVGALPAAAFEQHIEALLNAE